MSQVHAQTIDREGRSLTVVAGWDRTLEYYHCTVYDEADDAIFCDTELSYFDSVAGMVMGASVAEYVAILKARFGLELPIAFWDLVELKEDNQTIHNFGPVV